MKKLILFALMAAVLSTAVFAQALPAFDPDADPLVVWQAPQSFSTQGLFRSDADNFIRPDSFNTVEFEKWFGMISYRSSNIATLGYATKTGSGTFLGFFYSGSFWKDVDEREYEISPGTWKNNIDKKDLKVYTGKPIIDDPLPQNQIAFLLGLSNMGFRLSITSTLEYFKDEDFYVDNGGGLGTSYKYLQIARGDIYPEIAWSLTENIIEKGIRPWAALGLRFHSDYEKSQIYNFMDGSTEKETVNSSQNQTDIKLSLGLGGLTISEKDDWKTILDFSYSLTLPIYSNKYNKTPDKIEKIKGLNASGSLSEVKEGKHVITPSLGTEWKGDKVSLKAKVDLGMKINTKETIEKNYDLKNDGDAEKTFEFGFIPGVYLGMQWQVHPKLALNAGGRIGFNAITITNVKGDHYTNGSKDSDTFKETTTNDFGTDFSNTLTIGATFDTGDKVFFEATAGVSSYNGDQGIDVFKAGSDDGLFTFGSILIGLRF